MWTGIVMALAGVLFVLQSCGIIGPESSFMVENPDWFGYGSLIILAGIITSVVGRILQK